MSVVVPIDGEDYTLDLETHSIRAEGLRRVAGHAEARGVTLCVELLNSRVDHPGYQGDRTSFVVDVVRQVGSPRVKVLYDVYHMQIMEGDLAPTIEAQLDHIWHIQLADNPGRHEPGSGEINYPFLFGFLDRIGYDGWIGAEYKPAATTAEGLGWFAPYAKGARAA